MKQKMRLLVPVAGVLMLGLGYSGSAAPLPVGDTVITGTTVAAQPELAGTIIEDVLTPYSFTGDGGLVLTGNVQNRVVRSDVDGTLDFYWRIIPDTNSTGHVIAFRVSGFGDSVWDANFRTDGEGN